LKALFFVARVFTNNGDEQSMKGVATMKGMLGGIAVATALLGCSYAVHLVGPDGEPSAQGQIVVHAFPPHSLTVQLGGKTYTGQWVSHYVDDLADIRRSFGASSRHYQRHLSGLDRPHTELASTKLQAEDGSALDCEWTETDGRGRGTCIEASTGIRHLLSFGSDGPRDQRVIP
jgi:hypothetical protein